MIKVQRGIECSNVNCDVPFCDGTFPDFILFYFFKGYMDETVWMGSKLKADDLQKMQLNSSTFHSSTHSLLIYSLDIVLYISAEKSLGPLWFSPTGAH